MMIDDENIPKVINTGTLDLMGKKLKVYLLDNGQRVFENDDLDNFCSDVFDVNLEEFLESAIALKIFRWKL